MSLKTKIKTLQVIQYSQIWSFVNLLEYVTHLSVQLKYPKGETFCKEIMCKISLRDFQRTRHVLVYSGTKRLNHVIEFEKTRDYTKESREQENGR